MRLDSEKPELKSRTKDLTGRVFQALTVLSFAGYKKYYGNHLNNSDFLLQKRFDDEVGKKYFIDVWVYEHSKHDYYSRNSALPPVSFQPEVQFQREEDMTLNMTFIMNQDSTISEVEQQVECLWLFLEKPYYERFSEC